MSGLPLLLSTTLPPRLTRVAHAALSRYRWQDVAQEGRMAAIFFSFMPSARAFATWASTQSQGAIPARRLATTLVSHGWGCEESDNRVAFRADAAV